MKSEMLRTGDAEAADRAAAVLSQGGIAVFPTETVYGMAVDPSDEKAVHRLYEIKGRDCNKPLTRFISSPDRITDLDPLLRLQSLKCGRHLFPGPLTLVIESLDGSKTGVRMSSHPFARQITCLLDFSPAVTSVNRSGEAPLTEADRIIAEFGDAVDLVIDGGPAAAAPSTVAEIGSHGIRILREGPVSLETIRETARVTVLFICSGNICRSPAAEFVLKDELSRRYGTDYLPALGFEIISAGTLLFDGKPAHPLVESLMKENGIDISSHASQPLTADLLARADFVFVMDSTHSAYIQENHQQSAAVVQALAPEDIEDPYEENEDVFRTTLAKIRHEVKEVVKLL
jgi:tRNA threonylcarbamoyl adenosine modification protein (Sua5/YciO/YrdC/YwlC family)